MTTRTTGAAIAAGLQGFEREAWQAAGRAAGAITKMGQYGLEPEDEDDVRGDLFARTLAVGYDDRFPARTLATIATAQGVADLARRRRVPRRHFATPVVSVDASPAVWVETSRARAARDLAREMHLALDVRAAIDRCDDAAVRELAERLLADDGPRRGFVPGRKRLREVLRHVAEAWLS